MSPFYLRKFKEFCNSTWRPGWKRRGMLEGGTVSTFKRVRVCAPVDAWRWHSHNLHLEPGVCACVNIWRWCNNLLQLCMCAHVHGWRWHSDTATISILNYVCVLIATIFILTRECVCMSMIGGGIATISILNRECVCLCHA